MTRVFLSLLFCLTTMVATAQTTVDAKVNVGSLLTGGANVAADFGLSDNISLSAGLAYSSLGFRIGDEDSGFRYRSTRFIPEFRYYLNPREGADRFFLGAYGKIGQVTANDTDSNEKETGTRGALGILLGHKWVAPSGVVVELNGGLGRATVFSDSPEFDAATTILTTLDLRLGILVGYRF